MTTYTGTMLTRLRQPIPRFFLTLLFVALLFVVVILGAVKSMQYGSVPASQPAGFVHVERVFVDLNGDGLLDLLYSGEVVYNPQSPLPQP